MKKLLFFTAFAIIGCQSALAMNPRDESARQRQQSAWERETYGTREEQRRMNERNQQVNTGYGLQAAQKGENLYQIIGVDAHATMSQISSAYRQRARQLHQAGDMRRLKRLNHAKDILTDPQARAAYDANGQLPMEMD